MKTKVRTKARIAALLASGGFVMAIGGNCVADNFWVNTWSDGLGTFVSNLANNWIFSSLTQAFIF